MEKEYYGLIIKNAVLKLGSKDIMCLSQRKILWMYYQEKSFKVAARVKISRVFQEERSLKVEE